MVVSTIPVAVMPTVEFDPELVRKLPQVGPRYTSYPTADRFIEAFGYRDYLQAVARSLPGVRRKLIHTAPSTGRQNHGLRLRIPTVQVLAPVNPDRIRELYDVKATRIEPVGLVYLWPVTG